MNTKSQFSKPFHLRVASPPDACTPCCLRTLWDTFATGCPLSTNTIRPLFSWKCHRYAQRPKSLYPARRARLPQLWAPNLAPTAAPLAVLSHLLPVALSPGSAAARYSLSRSFALALITDSASLRLRMQHSKTALTMSLTGRYPESPPSPRSLYTFCERNICFTLCWNMTSGGLKPERKLLRLFSLLVYHTARLTRC